MRFPDVEPEKIYSPIEVKFCRSVSIFVDKDVCIDFSKQSHNIVALKELLGHTSIMRTMIYLRLAQFDFYPAKFLNKIEIMRSFNYGGYIEIAAAAMATVAGIETVKRGNVEVKSIQEYQGGQ